jgi:penicillin amidase
MMKKILLLVIAMAWLWAIQQRWGDLPIISRFFIYASSPLQIDGRFENSTAYRETPYGNAEVGFDSLGIPHVFAANLLAADYATGFVHARDRLFQMEMVVRVVTGRVSEVAGEAALRSDLFWRKFEFDSLVPLWYAQLGEETPEVKARLEAYAKGVNDYQRLMPFGSKPLEYHLLGIDPTPWEAHNIYYLLKYMTHVLTYSEDDLKGTESKSILGADLNAFWFPSFSRVPHPIYPDFTLSDSLLARLLPEVTEELVNERASFPEAYVKNNDELSLGSNNWAIHGKKSATGNPFLCNDTHLQIALPSTWYEIHKAVNGQLLRGFSIAGSPFIITGFNDSIAWGMTNATWDLVDFYQLEINAAGDAYKLDGQWTKLEAFEVSIPVKGQPDFKKTYFRSHFGPVDTAGGRALAVSWIGHEATNEALAFHGLEQSNTVGEAFAALQNFMQPPQNFILADHRGEIGLITAGMAALHPNPEKGIRYGRERAQKIGYVPMHNHLNSFNPDRAYLYSANQEHVDHALSAHLSTRYEPAARGKRITQLLEGWEQLGRPELATLQTDIIDLEYALLATRLAEVAGPYARWFEGWDGHMDTALVAPTLFYSFKNQLVRAVVRHLGIDGKLPPSEQHIFNSVALDDSLPFPMGWKATRDLVQLAWDSSVADLQIRFGTQPNQWVYGRFHLTNIQHLLRLPALAMPLFSSNGSNRTVNVASRLPVTHAASMRTIIELTPQGPNALLMLTGGQSGRFNSRHFHDQVNHWLGGGYHEARLSKQFDPAMFLTTISFNR